jgi:hypothetical protein
MEVQNAYNTTISPGIDNKKHIVIQSVREELEKKYF